MTTKQGRLSILLKLKLPCSLDELLVQIMENQKVGLKEARKIRKILVIYKLLGCKRNGRTQDNRRDYIYFKGSKYPTNTKREDYL